MIFKGKTKEDIIQNDAALLEAIDNGMPYKSNDRILTPTEKAKRGCGICAFAKYSRKNSAERAIANLEKGGRVLVCAFGHCPLHELDKYNDYREYMRETDRKMEKAMSQLLVKYADQVKETKNDGAEKPPEPPVPVDKKTRWLIGVRRSQGFTLDQMMREFGLPKEQILEEIKKYDKKHSYV